MRRLAVLIPIVLGAAQAKGEPVDLSKSPCLQPPMQVQPLIGEPPLAFRAGAGRTWDARDQVFMQDEMVGTGVLAPEGASDNTCILGATLVGPIGPDVTWRSSIKPDGIQHARPTGSYQVHGAWISRVNDALSPPKATDISRTVTFFYRDIYAREIRDDLLENDSCLGGEIADSLFDGVHMGFSERPGGNTIIDLGPEMPVVTIKNTMVRLECQTDVRGGTGCPPGQSHGQWFKLNHGRCKTSDGQIGPRYVLDNVIFRADETGTAGIAGLRFPEEARLTATNVTVLYVGPGMPPSMPSGVRLVTDRAEAERIWDEARAKWLADHRCDSNGDDCRYLTSEPLPPPPEAPEITAMYNAVSGLIASTEIWRAELPEGNLRRVGRNTGIKHSKNLHNAVQAMNEQQGDHTAFAHMHSLASRSIERALSLSSAVEAGDGQAAFLVSQPELTEAIVLQVPEVVRAYETTPALKR